MSFNEKFINYSSITTFLLIYLALKSTKGIDLTDEMQYYLQIKSLIEAGILFQNDLFFQQTVYIIFYPFFWGLNALFGYEGFIFTGRILFAFLILFFFIFCVHSLRKSEFEPKFIPLTALSMSVALVGLNIFAINYNSFSLFLWGLFLLQFLNWGKHSKTNIQLMPLLAIFSNPFLASAMAITIWIRFLADKDLGLIKKSLYLNGLGLMACALLIFQFSDLNVLIQSIEFTKEFSIGSAIFSSTYQILTLISLPIFYVLIKILMEKNNVYKIFLLVAFSNLVISFSFLHIFFGVQFLLIKLIALIIFYLSLHIYSLKRCQDNLTKQTIKWLALSTFIFCIFSALSSSNGLNNAIGPLLISTSLLIAISFAQNRKSIQNKARLETLKVSVLLFIIPLMVLINNFTADYREEGLLYTNHEIKNIPEFKFLKTSQSRSEFLHLSKEIFSDSLKGKKLLLIGSLPGLYFVTDSIPETCMLFFRNNIQNKLLIEGTKEPPLLQCSLTKSPEAIMTISTDINGYIDDFIRRNFFTEFDLCRKETLLFKSTDSKNSPSLTYKLCFSE